MDLTPRVIMGIAEALATGRVATEAKAAKARFWVADRTVVRAAVDLRRRRAALEDIVYMDVLLKSEIKKKKKKERGSKRDPSWII